MLLLLSLFFFWGALGALLGVVVGAIVQSKARGFGGGWFYGFVIAPIAPADGYVPAVRRGPSSVQSHAHGNSTSRPEPSASAPLTYSGVTTRRPSPRGVRSSGNTLDVMC
jgi:hypothetical protein